MKLIALGDSIVEGMNASSAAVSWVEQVRLAVFRGYDFVNLAEGGSTAESLVNEQLPECVALRPDAVILGIGVNDSRLRPSLGRHEVPLERYEHLIHEGFATLKRAGVDRVVVSGQIPVIDALVNPFKPDKFYRQSYQTAYERVVRAASAEFGFLFLDNFARWLALNQAGETKLSTDGLHPNDAGHEELAHYASAFLGVHLTGSF